MKLPAIYSALTSEPQCIVPGHAAALYRLLESHSRLTASEFAAERKGRDICGQAVAMESMSIEGPLAFIPIGGPIGIGLGEFEKGAGAVDVGDISRDIDEAEENAQVETILLCFDSPGGMVAGTPELAAKIAGVQKPIYAFTNGGMIASAAYWIAAATDGIFATKSADIGSIGVYAPFLDSSEALAKEGYKVHVFSSGDFKGMGLPGTQLTAKQSEFMQSRVSEIADMFYAHVHESRDGKVSDEDMQGQTFKAETALRKGFIDAVVRDMAEVISFLS